MRNALAALGVDDAWCCVVSTEVAPAVSSVAITAATEAGALVIVNPSPVDGFDPAALACGPLLVVNEHEASELGRESTPAASAHALATRTGRPVVVTLGAAGAIVVTTESATAVPASEADVVDTTGAGDAFTGTLAASLVIGASLVEATEAAVTAAASCVSALGARAWLSRGHSPPAGA